MKIREERLFTARKSYKSNFPALVSKLFCTEKSARNFDLRNIPVEKSHSNIIFIPWPIQSQKDTKRPPTLFKYFPVSHVVFVFIEKNIFQRHLVAFFRTIENWSIFFRVDYYISTPIWSAFLHSRGILDMK